MKTVFKVLLAAIFLITGSFVSAYAREQIRVVGSSTVFPFIASAAERFGKKNDNFPTPIVEATGTGGGFKLFCGGIGDAYPDMTNASRPIKKSEIELCTKHGVTEIVELPVGFDGIVIANAKDGPLFALSKLLVFKALAYEVPKGGKLVANPYKTWRDIDASLPDVAISVYGPPPTSGTRDAFVEMVMDETCEKLPEFTAAYPDKETRKSHCGMVREDGVYIDSGENDNMIVQKLTGNKEALGIFGFSFLEQNAEFVKANPIDGINPTFDAIADGSYGIARSLFVYVKRQHTDVVPGIMEFSQEFTSDAAVGEDGYLILKGLIPLPPEKHKEVKAIAKDLTLLK